MVTAHIAPDAGRTCATTGLPVCLTAERFIRLHAVMAVVFLLIGGLVAILLALTRWPAVHLLDQVWYYRLLTSHGINMLIHWILFFEVAVLYFTCTSLLRSRLFSGGLAWLGFLLMLTGSVMVNVIVFMGRGDVLMTSYVPLRADPLFYLGLILTAVGTLVGVINFFLTLYIAKRDKTYEGSMPLVTFGALAAAIIAVVTILHGAAALVPALFWSLDWIAHYDAAAYRLLWWGLGHQSQQVNVCAMVAVWYFLATMTTGAKPLNEAVCRTAFVLYILFINVASAHHLLVDPGVSASWKIFNTSYVMYLAVFASLIHGYTVPASIEAAQRHRGKGRGLFGWLTAAPWNDPGFSAMFLSLTIFGFIGGITGVTLGTQQINIIAHNTLRITGHFHATVVGGTTLAFMGLTYYVVPLLFQREFAMRKVAKRQPFIFAAGITLMSIGMSFAGSYGVPRRHWDVEFSGAKFAGGIDPGAHLWLGVMGLGAIVAFTGLMAFILLTVHAVFLGEKNHGKPMRSWQDDGTTVATLLEAAASPEHRDHRTPGTMALVIVLLVSFAVYYFANWKALAGIWAVR